MPEITACSTGISNACSTTRWCMTLLAGPPRCRPLDQLQVVDHDQVHSLVEVQPPGLAADLHHPLVGGVVDVYGEFRELPYGVDDEILLGGAVEAEADPV